MKIRREKKAVIKFSFIILSILIVFISGYIIFEKRLDDIIQDLAENTVKAKAGIIISTAIYEEVESDNITYDKLVAFEKDSQGKITALKTNIIEINRLKAKLTMKILDSLENMDSAELGIPLGSVIGGDLFNGKGPGLKINVIPVGSIEAEIIGEMTSAGINQSRHQIMMKVKANLSILTSVSRLETEIETHVCIAETVIVGDVPGNYTNINTQRSI